MKKRVGFVSIIGRPSSGKSTLINYIYGYKVSIVSKHPQTTRFLIRGIYNSDDSQIIFIDSPGYHHFNSNLNKGLSNLAIRNLNDGDLILYLVDITRDFGEEEIDIIEKLKESGKKDKIIITFNKIDEPEIKKETKEEILKRLGNLPYVEISAKFGKNVDKLLSLIKERLPEGEMFYPEDYVTDQPIPFRIGEVVREKIFNNTRDEVPHSTYVEVKDLKVYDNHIIANAIINVETDSQKGILIGNKGSMIKKIGEQARKDLEDIFERKVSLFLSVKVDKNWRKNNDLLKKMFSIE
ncbi:MAG TPA: GTPase Era [Spirochaetota bacterium]|nr:GTPase Era [Spirochaetota bacterium]HOL57296.1 GTPase Era [Spirochaetota bacterium]HPP05196.1 GTPase Era [Spirochaetota bacterium]